MFKLLRVGTDIEVFLRNTETKEPVAVCGLLGGTKSNPKEIGLGKGYTVQEDNVAAEFNIPAVTRVSDFITCLATMENWLGSHFKEKGLELDISPSVMFNIDQLKTRQAQTFGCEPDFSAWTLEENDIDRSSPELMKLRTAGGHVHVSFTVDGEAPEQDSMFLLIKMLDVTLGIPSLFADKDIQRRKLYGKAGAFRPKQYASDVFGVEYRTLSNFWFSNAQYQQFVFRAVAQAIDRINDNPNAIEACLEKDKTKILLAINEYDLDVARDLMYNWGLENFPDTTISKVFGRKINPVSINAGEWFVPASFQNANNPQ